MKIAVIGTGWLGAPLANQLIDNGHEVWGSKRTKSAIEARFQEFIYPETTNESTTLISQMDCVILAFPPGRNVPSNYTENCLAVVELLSESCNVVMLSSTGVYENTNVVVVEDDLKHDQRLEHPIVQTEFELIQRLQKRLTIIRLAGLVGPNRFPASAMAKSGKTYAANEPINLIHLVDAVGSIVWVIENTIWGEIINCCAENHPLKGEYYTWMANKLGIPAPLFETIPFEGKIISSEKSRQLGYVYLKDNVYDFMD